MSRESILATLVTASALLLLLSGLIFGFKYKSNADAASNAKEQLNSQQLVTSSVLRSMSVFNMISKAAYESQENNNTKSKQRVESTSFSIYRVINALLSLFLTMLLVSCSGTPTKYVRVPPVPIPENLTRKCPVPSPTLPFTWQSSLLWNESLLTALENCNEDKAAIQRIELERQKND